MIIRNTSICTILHETFMVGNFRGSVANYYFVVKHSCMVAYDGPRDYTCDGDY